ncbi:uncharacterized protein LOC120076618 [Benincasa hispida]|uniref:uncharacterized protein LOC120076618 n=1 Tax=Benincasa hispida TaxID=102211 RepID=UPI0018FF4B5E|nr:uncharacterized protein LOC120076618 [Benincasa hispida]
MIGKENSVRLGKLSSQIGVLILEIVGKKPHTLDRSLSVLNFDFDLTDKVADNGISNGSNLLNLKAPTTTSNDNSGDQLRTLTTTFDNNSDDQLRVSTITSDDRSDDQLRASTTFVRPTSTTNSGLQQPPLVIQLQHHLRVINSDDQLAPITTIDYKLR